jgi:hypothetical protein
LIERAGARPVTLVVTAVVIITWSEKMVRTFGWIAVHLSSVIPGGVECNKYGVMWRD